MTTSRTGATENIGGVQFYNSSNALRSQMYGTNDGKLKLATNGSTVALTLDASQNATFAGTIDSGAITTSGTLRVDAGSSGMIDFGKLSTTAAYGRLYADSTGTYIGSKSNHSLFLRTNNQVALSISTDRKTTINSAYTLPNYAGNAGQALRLPLSGTELEWYSLTSFPSISVSGTATVGALDIPSNGTNDTRIEIGTSTLASHNAYIDLVGDTTYTDYGLRLIRYNSGANTNSQIVHRGTGSLFIEAADAGSVVLKTNGSDGLTINSSQNATFAGTITSGAITSSGVLTLSADTSDVLNFSANSTNTLRGIAFNNRSALTADYNDNWLRLNANSEFSNGTYTPANLRVDGAIYANGGMYQGVTQILDASRNLLNIGTISSGAITSTGSITSADFFKATGGNLKFSAGGNHIFNVDLNGKIYPQTHNAVDLGFSATLAFRNLYLTNAARVGSLLIGATTVIDASRNLTNIGAIGSTYFSTTTNVNSTGAGGAFIPSGYRLGFDQSGTRSWTQYAAGGNLLFASGDGNGAIQANNATFTRLEINATNIKIKGDLLANSDGAFDIGASGANRPRNLYLSNSITASDITTTGVGTFGGAVQGASYKVGTTTVIDASRNITGVNIDAQQANFNTTSAPNFTSGVTGLRISRSGGPNAGDYGNGITFGQHYWTGDTSNIIRTAGIFGKKTVGNGSFGGGLEIFTQPNGSANMSVALSIDHTQNATFAGTISSGNITAPKYYLANSAFGMGIVYANSASFDTVDSGNNSDPLELVYYSGSGVRVGGGSGNKYLSAGSIEIAGTTVIDASRNLTNIAAITATGKIKTTSGELEFTSHNHKLTTNNANNVLLKSGGSGPMGLLGQDSGSNFRWQLYGDGTNYGFLNAAWANWDIKKTINGKTYFNDNSSYWLNPPSNSKFNELDVAGNLSVGGTISSNAANSTGVNILADALNNANDASLYIRKTNNNDWGIKVEGTGSATEYGISVRMNGNSVFAYEALKAGGISYFQVGAAMLKHTAEIRANTFSVNGTTVIDASRNLTNIGTISSGAITSTGITLSTTYPKLQLNDTTGVDRNFSVEQQY